MSMFLKEGAKRLSIKMVDLPGAPRLKTTNIFNFDNIPDPDYWETPADPSDLEGLSADSDVFSDDSTPPPTPTFLESDSTESDIDASSEEDSSDTSEDGPEEDPPEEQEDTTDGESAASGFSPKNKDDDSDDDSDDSQKLPANFGSMFAFAPDATQGVKRKTSDRIDEQAKRKPDIILISSDEDEDDDVEYVRTFTVQGTPPLTGSNNYTWPWSE